MYSAPASPTINIPPDSTFVVTDEPTLTCHHQSPQSTPGLPLGLDKCTMTCVHQYGIVQSSFTALKICSMVKNLPANAGDVGSMPGSGRSSGEGNGNPLQYSCLGKPTDREAWCTTVHGVSKSRTRMSN